jgi:hypothetical protein
MFSNKKLYKIIYQTFANYVTVIAARDKAQALKKFYKQAKKEWFVTPDILSIQEIFVQ